MVQKKAASKASTTDETPVETTEVTPETPTPTAPTPAPTGGAPDAQPVDAPAPVNAAHPVDEDPEQHIGEETNDPWDDEAQVDWPGGVVQVPEVKS